MTNSVSKNERGDKALWKWWVKDYGHDTSAFEDENGVVGPNPETTLDEWETGFCEAWGERSETIRAIEKQHERDIHERGMLDYYKGYEAGLKNAKKHLIKMMTEEDKEEA